MTGITQTQTTSFKVDCLSAQHNFSTLSRNITGQDTFKIALYSIANGATLDATTTAYTSVGETVGPGYVAGGAILTINQTPTSSGTTAYVNFGTVIWGPGAALSADGALIYNSTNSNKAVSVLSFGGTKTSSTVFTISFPASITSGVVTAIVQTA